MRIDEWLSKEEIRKAMKTALVMGDTYRHDALAQFLLKFED